MDQIKVYAQSSFVRPTDRPTTVLVGVAWLMATPPTRAGPSSSAGGSETSRRTPERRKKPLDSTTMSTAADACISHGGFAQILPSPPSGKTRGARGGRVLRARSSVRPSLGRTMGEKKDSRAVGSHTAFSFLPPIIQKLVLSLQTPRRRRAPPRDPYTIVSEQEKHRAARPPPHALLSGYAAVKCVCCSGHRHRRRRRAINVPSILEIAIRSIVSPE